MQMKVLLDVGSTGFSVTVLSPDAEVPMPTVEQQCADPNLGLMANSSSTSTLVKALNRVLELATDGREKEVLKVK